MNKPHYSLTLDEFRALAAEGNLIPLYREILADYETPVSAFAKIDQGPTAYLLESVAGGENWARYSFLGSGSSAVIHEENGDLRLTRGKKSLLIQSRRQPPGTSARTDGRNIDRWPCRACRGSSAERSVISATTWCAPSRNSPLCAGRASACRTSRSCLTDTVADL